MLTKLSRFTFFASKENLHKIVKTQKDNFFCKNNIFKLNGIYLINF